MLLARCSFGSLGPTEAVVAVGVAEALVAVGELEPNCNSICSSRCHCHILYLAHIAVGPGVALVAVDPTVALVDEAQAIALVAVDPTVDLVADCPAVTFACCYWSSCYSLCCWPS